MLGYVQHQLNKYSNKQTDGYEEGDYIFTAALLSTLCDFEVAGNNELVQKAFSLNILDTTMIGLDCFDRETKSWRVENLDRLKRDCAATVHDAMEWWACFRPEEPSSNFPLPFVRRVKSKSKKEKIGRNDPCHCGSGKKYKKCCLVQEI